MTILVVITSPDQGNIFKNILSNEKFEVEFVTNYIDALEMLNKRPNHFSLLIANIDLKSTDSLTAKSFIETIRKSQNGYSKIPVLAMTFYKESMSENRRIFSDIIQIPSLPNIIIDKTKELLKIGA